VNNNIHGNMNPKKVAAIFGNHKRS
jgi:hypothetical protein